MTETQVFDRAAALEIVDGRMDILMDLARTFLDHYHQILQPLEGAVRRVDRPALADAAHDLKGTLSFFGPTGAAGCAVRLQHMAANAELSEIQREYESLQRQFNGLAESLRQLMAENGP